MINSSLTLYLQLTNLTKATVLKNYKEPREVTVEVDIPGMLGDPIPVDVTIEAMVDEFDRFGEIRKESMLRLTWENGCERVVHVGTVDDVSDDEFLEELEATLKNLSDDDIIRHVQDYYTDLKLSGDV